MEPKYCYRELRVRSVIPLVLQLLVVLADEVASDASLEVGQDC